MISEINQIDPHKWVETYADFLYAYTIMRINDEEQAKDLVQETFLAALEKVNSFEGKSSERTWLTAILRNKIIDVYRKRSSGLINVTTDLQKAEQEQADFFDHDQGHHWNREHAPCSFGIDDHDPIMNKELKQVLQKCMQKLPALWIAVFTMKHIDDEATDIICAELKVTAANFWVIIHRAKLNLRVCLQKNWI